MGVMAAAWSCSGVSSVACGSSTASSPACWSCPGWTFTAFNVVGAVLWTGLWGLAAYFLEKDFHAIADTVEQFKPLAVGLSLAAFLGLLGYLLWRRRRRRGKAGSVPDFVDPDQYPLLLDPLS